MHIACSAVAHAHAKKTPVGITPVPREIENYAYAKNLGGGVRGGGDMRCILGDKQVAYGLKEAWASTN